LEAFLKALSIFIAALIVVAALSAFLLYRGIIRFNYPSFEEFPVQGVDVSHHQGDIDWQRLKCENTQFAYIKASEGVRYKDPKFVANWNGAIRAGVVPGAYHFFTLCKPGAEQATNFLTALASVNGGGLPPAVDLEFGGNCRARPDPEAFAPQLEAFLQELRAATGCSPVLYVTQEFYNFYIAGRFQDSHFWARDVYTRPRLRGRAQWNLWQFANRGRLPGVGTYIDLNVFNGTPANFNAFLCGATRPGVPSNTFAAMVPMVGRR
jgi:lysozyme